MAGCGWEAVPVGSQIGSQDRQFGGAQLIGASTVAGKFTPPYAATAVRRERFGLQAHASRGRLVTLLQRAPTTSGLALAWRDLSAPRASTGWTIARALCIGGPDSCNSAPLFSSSLRCDGGASAACAWPRTATAVSVSLDRAFH